MKYTQKIEMAIKVAADKHRNQTRKFSKLPYITHLVSVSFILGEYTNDEAAIVAALLHDTLEDTDYSEAELKKDFGDEVFGLVKAVTEPDRKALNLSWLNTKLAYAKQLEVADKRSVMIAAADKTHNSINIITDFADKPCEFVKYFGNKHDDRIQAYQTIADVINSRLESEEALLSKFNETFTSYLNLVNYVKENCK